MKGLLPALTVILLVPLLLVDLPPLLDYPNHLARASVLAFGADDPIVSQFYQAQWRIIPNLGLDLILPWMMQVLPIHIAGRIVIAAAVLLPVFGTLAYSRAVFARASLWPYASALTAYNATLMLGFVNFVASIGIALILAAIWIRYRESYPLRSVLGVAVGAIALFFCHLMGLVYLLILLIGYEAEWFWRQRRSPSATLWRGVALLPVILPALLLYSVSQLATTPALIEWSSAHDKLWQLLLPFANYILPLDIATAGLLTAVLLTCVLLRRCAIRFCSGFALLTTAILYIAAPYSFKDTFYLDSRVTLMLLCLLFGGLLPDALPRPISAAILAACSLCFIVRTTVVAAVWYDHQDDIRQLRQVIASIPPGARVFVTSVAPEEAPDYWHGGPLARRLSSGIRLDIHIPALLLIERRAFWPFLFDNPSQQPVRTLSPYRELAQRIGSQPDHHAFDQPGRIDLCGFDYLLLMEAGGDPNAQHFAADRLRFIDGSDAAALYRVRPTACPM